MGLFFKKKIIFYICEMRMGQVLLDESEECANCGEKCVLVDGEMVCPSCGLIANHESIAIETDSDSKLIFKKGNIGHIINNRLRLKRNKSLLKVLGILDRLEGKLNLPQVILSISLSKYIKIRDNLRSRQITHVTLFAATLVSCARSVGYTISFAELYNAFEEMGYKIKQKEMLRALSFLKNLGLYSPPAGIENFVCSIVGRLLDEGELRNYSCKDFPTSQFIIMKANEFLKRIGEEALVGKNPRVIASAAVYAAIRQITQNKKTNITQGKIAKISGVAEYSVRDCYSRIFSPLVSIFEKRYLHVPQKANTSSIICQEYIEH